MSFSSRVFYHEFLNEFNTQYNKNKGKILQLWKGPRTKWTAFMLGDGMSRKKEDYGLLGDIGKKFGYKIQAEWLRLDQVWYWWYPRREDEWITDVVIEHENDHKNIQYTLIKLCEIKLEFRVLITYLEIEERDEVFEMMRDIIQRKLLRPVDKFLIILGHENEGEIIWDGYELDSLGNKFEIPPP